jgi:regulator of protease activity HflC (stomatin/prohibitin superfamily)
MTDIELLIAFIVVAVIVFIAAGLRIAQEYERGVVFLLNETN